MKVSEEGKKVKKMNEGRRRRETGAEEKNQRDGIKERRRGENV